MKWKRGHKTKLDKEQIFMLTFSYGTSDEQLNRGCDNIEFWIKPRATDTP